MRIDEISMDDIHIYQNHLLELSPHDRQLRFGCFMNDEAIKRYIENTSKRKDPILVIWNEDKVVACSHIGIFGEEAEFGISVSDKFRNQGYGRLVFIYSIMWAKQHGARVITTQCVAQNKWIIELARREGMILSRDGGEVFARRELKVA